MYGGGAAASVALVRPPSPPSLLLDRLRSSSLPPSFRFTAGTSTVSKYYSKARFALSDSRPLGTPASLLLPPLLGRSSYQNSTLVKLKFTQV